MSYWRIFLLLFLVFLIGIFMVADNLNEQLSCQAAQILQLQVADHNLTLSVLNTSVSFPLPAILRKPSEVPGGEVVKQAILPAVEEAKPKVRALARYIYEEAWQLGHKVKSWVQDNCNGSGIK